MKKCPYCKEEIQDNAVKCKHCGSKIKRGVGCGGLLIVLFCIGVIGAVLIPELSKINQPSYTAHRQIEKPKDSDKHPVSEKKSTVAEEAIRTFIQGGLIGKIEIESNEVWVDENLWYSLTVPRKESFIDIMSRYFNEKRGYERVTVYGLYTGKILAKTSLTGVKFY